MTRPDVSQFRCFKVIECSPTGATPSGALPPQPFVPKPGASELAADMASLFAAGLTAHHPLSERGNPHAPVMLANGQSVTLHELLCQIRNLSWHDAGQSPVQDGRSYGPVAHQRRTSHWNKDRQLTLGTLRRFGVVLPCGQEGLSQLVGAGCLERRLAGPLQPLQGAPMSSWLRWSEAHAGAGLALPGTPRTQPRTAAEMARLLLEAPAGQPFYVAALAALARDLPLDPGLAGSGRWTAPRVMALVAEAESRARRAALSRFAAPDREMRPAVTAARMTVHLGREEEQANQQDDRYRRAADELAAVAPDLLSWVSAANALNRGGRRFETSLFLPLGASNSPSHPSDAATHVAVAGAMATVLKAVLDESSPFEPTLGRADKDGAALGLELDRAVSNISEARCLGGGWYPVENHQDIRLGQSIALQLLRETLEQDNVKAELGLRDFDGRRLSLVVQPRSFGRGFASLHLGTEGIGWPQAGCAADGHLTAVV